MRLSMIWPLRIALVSSFDIALLTPYQSVSVSYLLFLKGVLFFFFSLFFSSEPLHMLFSPSGMIYFFHLQFSCTPLPSWYTYSFFKVHFNYLPCEDLALHSCLGCCFLFCTNTVISIALHYDSNHHWAADVYFYFLLPDFELLEGRDQFLYLFNLKEHFNILCFI